ncbi:DUF1254 domain-containing protein [Listeria monocytogenes]|uniref:DUF1254 domain-containing protein n=1 Tax=Listeria seeligeri TaxID=1640 RepID=UPI0022EA3882|nr:DUF1254 domain-containing protein [Listeria seeligeri]EKT6042398.1 DUF1254 domain-containing protein [Listeria monocytogenes]EKT6045415.1 DUF1254 domain-containing protein [Listeria monocytogenes]
MSLSTIQLTKLTEAAYFYGFPLVFNLEQVYRYVTTGIGANEAATFNTFSHAKTLGGPKDTFVSLNNDTVYSMAQLDLSVGPLILTVPDTGGRYYVLQFVDAWTNNFAYVGTRSTGTKSGSFYLTPPNWTGIVPKGMIQIKIPTRIASIVGRWACDNTDDLKNVIKLQKQTNLTALNSTAKPIGLPIWDTSVSKDIQFFEKMRAAMWDLLPAEIDRPLQESFAPLQLVRDRSLANVDNDLHSILAKGSTDGHSAVAYYLNHGTSKVENGWHLVFHAFDYNASFFEVGTVNDPKWIINNRKNAIAERAVAAMGGLWGNHAYEAAYIMISEDMDGNVLNGTNTYTLTLNPPPPVGAFWSVTMYNVPEYYMVDNSINRYSIGDRTQGIKYAKDGSLTITISYEEPSDDLEKSNWLPAPNGDFRPVLRMYMPGEEILKGEYHFPGIIKTN